jgi:hypothetical protein
MGPKESAVRMTLGQRPAGELYHDADPRVRRCFTGLFNGARHGHVTGNDGLFLGKAECEWDWEEVWPAMKGQDLVDYNIEEVTHPSGHISKEFRWLITDKGHEVRTDDIKYFRELMAAMEEDEASVTNGDGGSAA